MKIKVTFEVDVPSDANSKDIIDWLQYHLVGSHLDRNCPLCDQELEANWESINFKYEDD